MLSFFRGARIGLVNVSRPGSTRNLATAAGPHKSKREGDISSVFVSLSGDGATAELPPRFATIKNALLKGNRDQVTASWARLLEKLDQENQLVKEKGPAIIPSIDFADIDRPSATFKAELAKRGVAVVRGVVPQTEARGYKNEVEDYIKLNPWTKAFPSHDPQVFELYWSPSQVKARSHPNIIAAQRFLMNFWHSDDPNAMITTRQPLAYADRLRIRQPGDAGFALGPHVDGGSAERWEPEGYGLGDVYNKIWQGRWEKYDPWEASCRLPVQADLYEGAGACSMFRMFQGWLSLSQTAPKEGTLMVNPLLQLSTAYFLLRPFFRPLSPPGGLTAGEYDAEFLAASNWELLTDEEMTSTLQGASLGHAQELNPVLHPHLDLQKTMTHIPKINPGDFVVWHCDTIHAVDKVHAGATDSSVMYIPVCPVTESNARYVAHQRANFHAGIPAPDFPGGKGESEHSGRPTELYLKRHVKHEGLQAMGLEKLDVMGWEDTVGGRNVLKRANAILGF
ncbi:DUF1479-domain-containing protein [Aureobasidium sp. EXF-10728]|nr:DUF1479-domain-containing protein [Aureobasidium sp. EXF-10728]